jgi:ribosomal RNA-processing protein 17
MAKRGKGGSKSGKCKFEIKFDPQKRKEFLTGFKKRKDERRAKAKELVKVEERKAKRETRKEKRKNIEGINHQYEQIKAAMAQDD